jgi:hypothetical protein
LLVCSIIPCEAGGHDGVLVHHLAMGGLVQSLFHVHHDDLCLKSATEDFVVKILLLEAFSMTPMSMVIS